MIYKCSVCGYVYDEEKEGKPFSELRECPMCKQPPEKFRAAEEPKPDPGRAEQGMKPASTKTEGLNLNYPEETGKTDSDYRYMK